MKKRYLIVIILILFIFSFVYVNGLDETQLTACETAENNNNCNSLQDIGIVTKEQCCSDLNLCCTSYSVSKNEFKNVLISALTDYFTHPNNAKLNVAELKDLIVVYFSSHGNTIDLSGTGQYSGEDLINIYSKAKGITTQTCSSAGGTCKSNTCNTYNNCNSLSGSCSSGYCCSGNCTITTSVIIPPGTPILDIEKYWYVPLSQGYILDCNNPIRYIIFDIPNDLSHLSISLAGKHYFKNKADGSYLSQDPYTLQSKLVDMSSGKVLFDQPYDINIMTPTYVNKVCKPKGIACYSSTDSIPAGKYLFSFTFNPRENLCFNYTNDYYWYSYSKFSWVINAIKVDDT